MPSRTSGALSGAAPSPRIGILVVAYNAESTLATVLDRVPKEFRPRISQIFVCDDASQDSTYLVGLGYQQMAPELPLTVIRHPGNLGYGGNQKAGYRLAIEHDLDIVVLLHGDGQYAPERSPRSSARWSVASAMPYSGPGCWSLAPPVKGECRCTSWSATRS